MAFSPAAALSLLAEPRLADGIELGMVIGSPEEVQDQQHLLFGWPGESLMESTR